MRLSLAVTKTRNSLSCKCDSFILFVYLGCTTTTATERLSATISIGDDAVIPDSAKIQAWNEKSAKVASKALSPASYQPNLFTCSGRPEREREREERKKTRRSGARARVLVKTFSRNNFPARALALECSTFLFGPLSLVLAYQARNLRVVCKRSPWNYTPRVVSLSLSYRVSAAVGLYRKETQRARMFWELIARRGCCSYAGWFSTLIKVINYFD